MSTREHVKSSIDILSDTQIITVNRFINMLLKKKSLMPWEDGIEEAEPDEWDLKMISESILENDGDEGVPLEDFCNELGVRL